MNQKIKISNIKNFLVIIFFVLCELILFRGCMQYGMQFDEVYRKCNIFSIFNKNAVDYNQAIYSINLLGINIPIMYKTYISSANIIPWIFILFFKSPLIGIRTLYFLYLVIGLICIYYTFYKEKYVILRVGVVALIAFSPLLYPYVRFGWSSSLSFISLAIVYKLILIYNKNNKRIILFWITFVIAACVNIEFYLLWTVGAVIIGFVLLWPKRFLSIVINIRNDLFIIAGMALGLINYIIYNIAKGFPTITTLFNSLFFRDKYNENPIDYKQLPSFLESIIEKIKNLVIVIGSNYRIYFCLYFICLIISVILVILFIVKKKFIENRILFLPIIVLNLVFLFILISPNANWAHHFFYLVVPYSIMIIYTIKMVLLIFDSRFIRRFLFSFVIILLVLEFYNSNSKVIQANTTKGTGNFSPAIYQLFDFTKEHSIKDTDMVFINWGFHSQYYFLNKGEFHIQEIVFNLMGKSEEESYKFLDGYLVDYDKDYMYIPIYVGVEENNIIPNGCDEIEVQNESYNFINYLNEHGAKFEQEAVFYESDGSEVMALYKVSNLLNVRKNIMTIAN